MSSNTKTLIYKKLYKLLPWIKVRKEVLFKIKYLSSNKRIPSSSDISMRSERNTNLTIRNSLKKDKKLIYGNKSFSKPKSILPTCCSKSRKYPENYHWFNITCTTKLKNHTILREKCRLWDSKIMKWKTSCLCSKADKPWTILKPLRAS